MDEIGEVIQFGREPSLRDQVWDQLTAHFGEPRTKTERTMYGKVVAELLEAGVTADEAEKACRYVLGRFDHPSVFALTKWLSASLREQTAKVSTQDEALEALRRRNQ